MIADLPPMPTPPPIPIEVYLPRLAFDRISDADVVAAARRLRYGGTLHWRASTNDLPAAVSADSVRLSCMVGEAAVFVECFRALVDQASAEEDDALVIACAETMARLFDAVETAQKRQP
jgi:hypothetical protein